MLAVVGRIRLLFFLFLLLPHNSQSMYPVCEDAEDEDWNQCAQRYNFTKGATFRCQSPHHNEDTVKANLSKGVVWIKAVPQDGIPECWNNTDESV